MLFNAGAMALSAYVAGQVFSAIHGQPLLDHGHVTATPFLPGPLMAFAGAYFTANTFLVASAAALARSTRIFQTRRDGFLWTSVNYLAAAFISGALAQVANPITLPAYATLAVGCAGVYFSARTHVRLAQEVQRRAEQAHPAAKDRMADTAAA